MTIAMYVLGAIALAGLARHWLAVRNTTLAGPWSWLLLALLAMAVPSGSGDAARLLAATLTLCPGMSLLGAKRPQDRAWHFIVGSFWVVLSLPGIQSLLMGERGALDVHPARSWLLLATILFTVLNSLFGRFWPSVLLGGLGQTILLAPFLPWPLPAMLPVKPEVGWICVSLGVVIALLIARRHRPSPSLNTLWCDFRDAYGAVWTLRLAERLNETSRVNGWPVLVGWHGFESASGESPLGPLSSEQRRAFRQNLANLLRRFVDHDWISQRWGGE